MKRVLQNALNLLVIVVSVVAIVALAIATTGNPIAKAATTAEFTVTGTGEYIAITDNVTSYAFGTVAASSTTAMSNSYVGITNTSTVQTDQTIAVTGDWTSAGSGWTHDNTGVAGVNTAAMKASDGDGAFDVVVETLAGTPNYIYENCPAATDYQYEVELLAPTSFTDGEENSNTVRVTAAAG